jgi:hypothetical protein
MRELITITVAALAAGAAGSLVTLSLTAEPRSSLAKQSSEAASFDELAERIAILEETIASAGPLAPTAPALSQAQAASDARGAITPAIEASGGREQQFARRAQQRQEMFESRLRSAGWNDTEIDSLRALREQAGLELERQQYERMRKSMEENPDMAVNWRDPRSVIRDSLGDAKYEAYLDAIGRPAAVQVNNVLAGSAIDAAGLQPGDHIRRYGSERVFNERDLMLAILSGKPGETVAVEVERDGAIFHVSVPRGPLGTSRAFRLGMDY